MKKQIYLSFCILCAILTQGILASENNNSELKNNSGSRLGDRHVLINSFPYVVTVIVDGKDRCGGNILSANVILTTAECAYNDKISIRSGSSIGKNGKIHKALKIERFPDGAPESFLGDLALVQLDTPIDFKNSSNREIMLSEKTPEANATVTTFSWKASVEKGSITEETWHTISQKECSLRHAAYPQIKDAVICTVDDHSRATHSSNGAGIALVASKRLVGIRSSAKLNTITDDYINLNYTPYKNWISKHFSKMSSNEPKV